MKEAAQNPVVTVLPNSFGNDEWKGPAQVLKRNRNDWLVWIGGDEVWFTSQRIKHEDWDLVPVSYGY